MSEVQNISNGVIVPKDGIINIAEITKSSDANQVINVWSGNTPNKIDNQTIAESAILADIEAMAGIPDEPVVEKPNGKTSALAGFMSFFTGKTE